MNSGKKTTTKNMGKNGCVACTSEFVTSWRDGDGYGFELHCVEAGDAPASGPTPTPAFLTLPDVPS